MVARHDLTWVGDEGLLAGFGGGLAEAACGEREEEFWREVNAHQVAR
jgi:hypothetical protein